VVLVLLVRDANAGPNLGRSNLLVHNLFPIASDNPGRSIAEYPVRVQYLSKSLGDSDLSAVVTGVSLPLSTTMSVNTVLGYIKEYPQMRE
jgi:hypothetical protein